MDFCPTLAAPLPVLFLLLKESGSLRVTRYCLPYQLVVVSTRGRGLLRSPLSQTECINKERPLNSWKGKMNEAIGCIFQNFNMKLLDSGDPASALSFLLTVGWLLNSFLHYYHLPLFNGLVVCALTWKAGRIVIFSAFYPHYFVA